MSDEDVIEFIRKFYKREIKAVNRSDYIQKIITHLKQEHPIFIKSDYGHLKRICTEQVDKLVYENKIKFERIRVKQSPRRKIVINSPPLNNDIYKNYDRDSCVFPSGYKNEKINVDKNIDKKFDKNGGEKVGADRIRGGSLPPATLPPIPLLKLSDLAIGKENLSLIRRVLSFLKHCEIFKHNQLSPCVGAIVTGFPGSGKSTIVKAIAGEYNMIFVKKSAIDLITDFKKTSEEKVKDLFTEVYKYEAAILLIDDIDAILSSQQDLNSSSRLEEKRLVAQLCQCMDETSESHPKIIVFLTTSNISIIDSTLRRPGRFEYEICISMPDEQVRYDMLQILTKNINLNDVDLKLISRHTPGYVAGDLVSLVREAVLLSINSFEDIDLSNNSVTITQKNLLDAIRIVKPSSTREGFSTVIDVNWDDVGGLNDVKNHLKLALTGPIMHPVAFDSLGLHASTGVLLVGPPGCGKTLVAKAIAHVDGLNFISVRGPELISSYVGESERAVRNLFSRAQIAEPCVIFFDEIDSLCSKRSEDSNNTHSSRLVNQLLTEMDGILKRNRVFIIGATNRPDIIDPAIMRKGRFDRIFYVDLPSPQERLSILRTLTKNGTRPKISDDVNLEKIAFDFRCDNFSGADLGSLIRETCMLAFKGFLEKENHDELLLTYEMFDKVLSTMKPSLTDENLKHYEKLKKKYC